MLIAGCARPLVQAKRERLPDSVLADPTRPAVAASAGASQTGLATLPATDGVRQASAVSSETAATGLSGREVAGSQAEPRGPSLLRDPRGEPDVELPRRPTAFAGDPRPASSPPSDASFQIARLTRELEEVNPTKVEEFLDDARQAAARGNLEPVLAVWRATLEHERRSPSKSLAADTPPRATSGRILSARAKEADLPQEPPHRLPETLVVAAQQKELPEEKVRLRYDADEEKKQAARGATQDAGLLRKQDSAKTKIAELGRELRDEEAVSAADQLRNQMTSRLLYVLAGDVEEGLRPIPGSEDIDRRFWRNLLWSVSQYLDSEKSPRPEARAAQTVEMLEEAIAALREKADLAISTPILCKEVFSFGNYVEFESRDFRPGQGVVVYWEVRNFASSEGKEGFRTRMKANVEIYDANGRKRHESKHDYKDDVSRVRRHDFFCVVGFHLPPDLSVGDYVLKVVAIDKTTDKIAENQTRFSIR